MYRPSINVDCSDSIGLKLNYKNVILLLFSVRSCDGCQCIFHHHGYNQYGNCQINVSLRVPHVWVENMEVLFGHVAVGWVNFIAIGSNCSLFLVVGSILEKVTK